MADYVTKDQVIEWFRPYGHTDEGIPFDVLRDDVQGIPAADVVPVVHGRWEMRPTGMVTDTGPEYKAYCTVCNEPNKQYQPPFCPHCGVKMDGGKVHD